MELFKYPGVGRSGHFCKGHYLFCNFGYQYLACKAIDKPDDPLLGLPMMQCYACEHYARLFLTTLHQWKNPLDIISRLMCYLLGDAHSLSRFSEAQAIDYLVASLLSRDLLIFEMDEPRMTYSGHWGSETKTSGTAKNNNLVLGQDDSVKHFSSEIGAATKRKGNIGKSLGKVIKCEMTDSKSHNSDSTLNIDNLEDSTYVASIMPRQVDWDNSGPEGLIVKDPREFEVGNEMFNSFVSTGMEPDLALRISRELLESGVEEPKKEVVKKNGALYKLVPEGGPPPSMHTPYFVTLEMLNTLPNNSQSVGDLLGLPQVPESFDVYEMIAKEDALVYQSKIAPFKVNNGEFIRSGGGTQALVINKSSFSKPKKI